MSAGKICARIDYGLLRPVATDVAEVLQTTIGAVASCNISQAGDYIVLQLSYRLKSLAEEQYHTMPTPSSFWAPLLSPRVIPEPDSVYWTRTLQLIASSIGVAFLLVFVCCARICSASNRTSGLISFEEYEADDDDKSPWEGPMHPWFGSQPSQRESASGSSSGNIWSTSNSRTSIDLIINTDTPKNEKLGLLSAISQECDYTDGSVKTSSGRRPSVSELLGAPVNKLLQMATMTPHTNLLHQTSSASSAVSAVSDASEVLPFGSTIHSEVKDLLEMQSMLGRDSAGRTALHIAASMSDITAVRTLLDAEDGLADPRHIDYRGQTPVHTAASRGYDDIVAELVMFGYMLSMQRPSSAENSNGRRRTFSTNQQDQAGNTPLHLAAAKGHVDVVRALERMSGSWTLDLGAENNKGFTPLQLAAYNGHTDMVMKLLKLKPKAAFPRSQSSSPRKGSALSPDRATPSLSPLHIASTRGHVKLVRSLLQWMKEHEELYDDSSEEEDFPPLASRNDSRTTSPSTSFEGLTRSFSTLRGIASTSASKLQKLVSWKKRAILAQDFPVEMSHFDFNGDEDLLAVDDTEPLILKQSGAGGSEVEPEARGESDEAARTNAALQQSEEYTLPQPEESQPKPSDEKDRPNLVDADGESCRVMDAASPDAHPVWNLVGDDPVTGVTEILPPKETAPGEGHCQDAPLSDPLVQDEADDVGNTGKAAGKGSGVTVSAPKDASALQKKSRKPGIPSTTKPRPRVAGQAPAGRIAGSGSSASSSVQPRAGQRAGAKQVSSGTARERATASKGQSPKTIPISKSPTAAAAAPARQSNKTRIQAVPGKAAVTTGRRTTAAAKFLASGGRKPAKTSADVAIADDKESVIKDELVATGPTGPAPGNAAAGDFPTQDEAASSPPLAVTDLEGSASRPVTPSVPGAPTSSRPSTPKPTPELVAKQKQKSSQIVNAYGRPIPGPPQQARIAAGRRRSTDNSISDDRPSTVGHGVGRTHIRHSVVDTNVKDNLGRRKSALENYMGQMANNDAEDIGVRPASPGTSGLPDHLPDGVKEPPPAPRVSGWD